MSRQTLSLISQQVKTTVITFIGKSLSVIDVTLIKNFKNIKHLKTNFVLFYINIHTQKKYHNEQIDKL
jgi:hypothetical protein